MLWDSGLDGVTDSGLDGVTRSSGPTELVPDRELDGLVPELDRLLGDSGLDREDEPGVRAEEGVKWVEAGVEGFFAGGPPNEGVSDGAGIVRCPKVVAGAVAAGGVSEISEKAEELAFCRGGVGEVDRDRVAAVNVAVVPTVAAEPTTGEGLAPAGICDPGGVVPPVPEPGGADGGEAFCRRLGAPLPGIRISDAATTPAAAAAAAPRTGRRR